jgi:hypothetical protein
MRNGCSYWESIAVSTWPNNPDANFHALQMAENRFVSLRGVP